MASAEARRDGGGGAVTAAATLPVAAGSDGALTAIVSPLAAELAAVADRTVERRRVRRGGRSFLFGRLAGAPVVLLVTGDGFQAACRGVLSLLRQVAVRRLVAVGVAGGLSPRLEPGALIVARQVLKGGWEVPRPDGAWLDAALATGLAVPGTLITSDFILLEPKMKAALWRVLPEDGAAAVDLESAAYARLSAAHGVPFLVARAVLDPAEEALPLDFNLCRTAGGKVSRLAVLRQAVLTRGSLGRLLDLHRRLAMCSGRLAGFLEALLETTGGEGERP